jgi:Rrf2 family protein
MFSQTSEYALRVVVYLAQCRGKPVTNRIISSGTLVPQGYLAKVLQTLSRAGLVKSQRGLHGGTILSRAPEDLTLLDVVQAVDPIRRIASCPLALAAHGKDLCPLHSRLDQAIAGIEKILCDSTIADLMESTGKRHPLGLCTVPGTTNQPKSRRQKASK